MKSRLIIFCFLIAFNLATFQSANSAVDKIRQFEKIEILTDSSFTFNSVISSKNFKPYQEYALEKGHNYWLKTIVTNKQNIGAAFQITILPNFDNTLYYFERTSKTWVGHRSVVYRTPPTELGNHELVIEPHETDTIYVKINLSSPNALLQNFKASVTVTAKTLVDNIAQSRYIGWLAGMLMLLLYVLNYLYIYISFKDKSVLFYLIAQIGSMVYLTSYLRVFDRYLPNAMLGYVLSDKINYYSIDKLVTHVGILVVFYGFSQLNRSYLNSKQSLPSWDRVIRIAFYLYVPISVIIAVVNISGFDIEYYTLLYDNIFCLFFIASLVAVNIAAYFRKLPSSGAFLLANLLPLTFMTGIPFYHLIYPDDHLIDYWLIIAAIISQAFSFSIALVAHLRTVRGELNHAELKSQQLHFDLREAAYLNKLNEQDKELLQERLSINQRELTTSALFMAQKNELLTYLKTQIQDLKRTDRYNTRKILNDTLLMLEDNNQLDTGWDNFKIHFEQVHPHFFETLKKNHPTLTQKETRLYAYFEMKLSHKEIAALLGIDPASVRRAKTRLLKKMSLPADVSE